MNRIAKKFAQLHEAKRGGLVTFITAGDYDEKLSFDVLEALPAAGADIIELGMPFSDPMADGPAIQAASQRALAHGMTLAKTIDMVARFRKKDDTTPIVLMGYFNPVNVYGVERFAEDCARAGVDAFIIVDLPPEESGVFHNAIKKHGMELIFLTTPTSDDKRLDVILEKAGGFVYYVSVRGVTGTVSAAASDIAASVERIKAKTSLPVAVGFGIKTPEQAANVAGVADAAVVGSAIVNIIKDAYDNDRDRDSTVKAVADYVKSLADAIATG